MKNDIVHWEELTMNALPAFQTHLYDGWVLRFADGYTKRANSVNPIYASVILLPEKIRYCEERYAALGLPAVFKLTEQSPGELDGLLEEKGYERATPTNVMTKNIIDAEDEAGDIPVDIAGCVDDDWLGCYFAFNRIDEAKRETAAAVIRSITSRVLCAKIVKDGRTVACGLGVAERGCVGLYDIVVEQSERQKGYGTTLCRRIIYAAAHDPKEKAQTAYLQVVAGNTAACRLYEKLGFVDRYTYWYRVRA